MPPKIIPSASRSQSLHRATLSMSLFSRVRQIACQPTRDPSAYLSTLMENVESQAINAISKTDARAFCRRQMAPFLGLYCRLISESVQEPPLEDRVSKARLRLAESKTIKKISKRISRTFDDDLLRPSGLEVYSSHVI